MASSRDDFVIAIRSAFLKKSTQQKFSLLTLVFTSIFIILLSSFDFKIIRYIKIGINEIVYRSSFVVSIPENFIKNTFIEITDYSTFFNDYKKNKKELNELKSKNISNEIIQFENKELKELINDYVSSSDKILSKIIVDQDSPFLKSIIINKGAKDNIKIGTNIYDQSYLLGRVIEVNYKTARVLLLSDLNSNVPVSIAPQNIQAIITGSGDNYGEIKYIKAGVDNKFNEKSIVYTSGTGALFKSGIPIGRIIINKNNEEKNKFKVEFYSNFSQLKYVFAEVISKKKVIKSNLENNQNDNSSKNPIETKLKILEDEKKIIGDINLKFREENETLKTKNNYLNTAISELKNKVFFQKKEIEKFNLDTEEIEFLKMNLYYGHKCKRSFFNSKGFSIGSSKYKKCVMRKGRKN
jgi:rod shape-determining protein MreC